MKRVTVSLAYEEDQEALVRAAMETLIEGDDDVAPWAGISGAYVDEHDFSDDIDITEATLAWETKLHQFYKDYPNAPASADPKALTLEDMIGALYNLNRKELRCLAHEALLVSDGPDHIEGSVENSAIHVDPLPTLRGFLLHLVRR